jgi:hypothetical protein
MLYAHRYIRLTPSVAVTLLLSLHIMPHLASGPYWSMAASIAGTKWCVPVPLPCRRARFVRASGGSRRCGVVVGAGVVAHRQ